MRNPLGVVEDGALGGNDNMARDRDLFDLAEREGAFGCRVYRWDGPWVSLGKFQSPERDLVAPESTAWVLRPTGGKAVLHGHDLTVGMAVPFALPGIGARDLKAGYRWVAARLVEALRACGVPAELGERTRFSGSGARTADCFTHVSPNDVVHEDTGQKVCGCALLMGTRSLLLQASIPTGAPLVDPTLVVRQALRHEVIPWDPTGFRRALETSLEAAGSLAKRP